MWGKMLTRRRQGCRSIPAREPSARQITIPLNFGILTESFGMKLVVAKYESNDPAAKILAYYKDKMKKYGKVLECHNTNDNSGFRSDNNDDRNRPLKCEGDNSGPVRELKVGTEGDAHFVSIESNEGDKPTVFAIVYVRTRGKSGDI
jgi:hypothetical protein